MANVKRRRTTAPPTGPDLSGLLPDDCTQVIFSYLPSARDRCACAAVSKRWLLLLARMRGCEFNSFRKYNSTLKAQSEASRCLQEEEANDARLAAMAVGTYAHRLLGNLSVRAGAIPSPSHQQRLTDFGLHIVSQSFPNLRSLSLWDCFRIGGTGLASIARCCRSLERLDISNSPGIDDDGLVPIARNCQSLMVLSVESCPLVGDRSLLALAKCSSHLESISIARCPHVTDAGVASVVSHVPSLARVRLAHVRVGDATMEAVGRQGGSIRALALEGVVGLTASGLAWLSHATRLESLTVNSCVAHVRDWMVAPTPAFDSLRHVSIRGCRYLDDDSLASATESARHLESLKLERCDRITARGLVRAVQNCSRTLKVLQLSKCNNVGTHELEGEITEPYPLLDSITLRSCAAINDAFLRTIGSICANASHIGLLGLSAITDRGLHLLLRMMNPETGSIRVDLTGSGGVTDWGVVGLARAFGSRLEALSLEGCEGVGDRSLVVMGELCSGLRELDVSGSRVSDAGLVRLVTAEHQKLEVLSVAGCSGVTDVGLSCLEVMCGGLVGLNLQHCGGVTHEAVQSLRATLWWCDVLY